MIRHQAKRHKIAMLSQLFGHLVKKESVIIGIEENFLAIVTPIVDVIKVAFLESHTQNDFEGRSLITYFESVNTQKPESSDHFEWSDD